MNRTTELLEAVKAGHTARVQELLAADPALVNAQDESGNSAVLLAAYYGRQLILDVLLAHDVALNVFEAAASGNRDRVKALVEDDPARVNAFAHDGYTPLGLASFFGHLAVAEYLVAQGAEVNRASQNKMRVMPLHSALATRQVDIARLLIAHGAEVNVAQQDGFTPLHEAAQNGQEDMVALLLEHGAHIDAKRDDGETALSIAVAEGYTPIAELLRRHGAAE
ncbi:MAG TPA: ankyrin repeat domain-containing protein [Anaerolineae bacterium]|nr:ankyrin repeat domain-containing protein [Anaerolineae bacterium]